MMVHGASGVSGVAAQASCVALLLLSVCCLRTYVCGGDARGGEFVGVTEANGHERLRGLEPLRRRAGAARGRLAALEGGPSRRRATREATGGEGREEGRRRVAGEE